ncbi:MAG: hypothetical protein J6D28_03145 [Bacilli bacterium]|nr:hypothetical protein [Bacilli bacterium]
MKKAKNIKNSHKKKTNTMISTDNEMSKLIFLVLIVAAVFIAFYVITLFVTKKDEDKGVNEEQNYEATIQYDKILASNILSQKPTEYYVLAYFNDDPYVDLYKNHLMNYEVKKGENAVPYYYVDMDEVFNSSFIGEQSNLNVSNATDFKFSQTALLRIQKGKVISTYETKDIITAKFGRMTK